MIYRIIILYLLFIQMGLAQDHLVPENGVISFPILKGYHRDVANVLEGAYSHKVLAKVIVLPSFSNEYAVGVKRNDNDYLIFFSEASHTIWGFSPPLNASDSDLSALFPKKRAEVDDYIKTYPKTADEITEKYCEYRVDTKIAKSLIQLWETGLLKTRYSERARSGLDGISYHFSSRTDMMRMSGVAWSPEAGTELHSWVRVVDEMYQYCESQGKTILDLKKYLDNLK